MSKAESVHFDLELGGTKLMLVHPTKDIKQFKYKGALGALNAQLAQYGKF